MKPSLKSAAISLLIGAVLTICIGGIKYLTLDKPGFDPLGSCKGDPLCDPSPYLSIGYPWQYGNFNEANGNNTVLHFGAEDDELVPRYYKGFIADVTLYSLVAFVGLMVLTRFQQKKR